MIKKPSPFNIDYQKLPRRDLLCIDVKSFFASVEAVRRGIDPMEAYIIVISDFDRPGAVVLAASPKVKNEFGITTGSRKFQIPNNKKIILTEPSMGLYLQKNLEICDIFRRYVSEEDLWIYSIDEAFLDISSTRGLFGTPKEIALKIQTEVYNELGLVMAVGIGDNPLLAKLALDNEAKKTACQTAYWSYENVPEKIWKIPKLTDMWGISTGYERQLFNLGISSIYALAHTDPKVLERSMGIMGLQLFYHCWGVDYSRLSERVHSKNKSFGKGQILMEDYYSQEKILIIIAEMSDEIARRLRKNNFYCRGISLFIGFSKDCEERGFRKDMKLSGPTHNTKEINHYFKHVFLDNWNKQPVRQIYLSCTRVAPGNAIQPQLFNFEFDAKKETKIDSVLDKVKDKYGKTAIFKGHSLAEGSTFLERSGYIGGHKGDTDYNEKK